MDDIISLPTLTIYLGSITHKVLHGVLRAAQTCPMQDLQSLKLDSMPAPPVTIVSMISLEPAGIDYTIIIA